jgi:hypothetical protein
VNYLIDSPESERTFLKHLWGLWSNLEPMLTDVGINPYCCWALVEVEMRDLVAGQKGDVDILIGRLTIEDSTQFEIALEDHMKELASAHPNALIHFLSPEKTALDKVVWSGGIQWPPPTDYLVGVEVKCSRLNSKVEIQKTDINEWDMKSTKSSKQKIEKIRLQIDKLTRLGFNKVVLLDLIATPPADGVNIGAWLNASMYAYKSEKAMARIFGERLQPSSLSGHWVYSIGAVADGDETIRGAGLPRKYLAAQNIYNAEIHTTDKRQQMEQNITRVLSLMPKPFSLPVLLINCRVCGTIHRCERNMPCCQ